MRNRPIEAPEPTVVTRLIQEAGADILDMAAFLQLAATTGARREELCAIHWDVVDLENGTVTIARSVVSDSRGAFVEKDTKTHSIRRIALDPTSIGVLREHRRRAEERAIACGSKLATGAYVFSRAADSSRPWSPTDVTHEFAALRSRLGLAGVRLHDLRHFAATRLLAAGAPFGRSAVVSAMQTRQPHSASMPTSWRSPTGMHEHTRPDSAWRDCPRRPPEPPVRVFTQLGHEVNTLGVNPAPACALRLLRIPVREVNTRLEGTIGRWAGAGENGVS